MLVSRRTSLRGAFFRRGLVQECRLSGHFRVLPLRAPGSTPVRSRKSGGTDRWHKQEFPSAIDVRTWLVRWDGMVVRTRKSGGSTNGCCPTWDAVGANHNLVVPSG